MKKTTKPVVGATIVHAQTEDGTDIVKIDRLRVALMRDGNAWVAQGLEIDYAAEGDSIEEVKRQFQTGLMLTLRENVRVFGHIKNVLRAVPSDVWNTLLADSVLRQVHSQVSAYKVRQQLKSSEAVGEAPFKIPFGAINYYLRDRAAVEA